VELLRPGAGAHKAWSSVVWLYITTVLTPTVLLLLLLLPVAVVAEAAVGGHGRHGNEGGGGDGGNGGSGGKNTGVHWAKSCEMSPID
jgi:hypothetical protein